LIGSPTVSDYLGDATTACGGASSKMAENRRILFHMDAQLRTSPFIFPKPTIYSRRADRQADQIDFQAQL
jgi:UDP-N-acetylglucosamine 2-epimerase